VHEKHGLKLRNQFKKITTPHDFLLFAYTNRSKVGSWKERNKIIRQFLSLEMSPSGFILGTAETGRIRRRK
jgi:hypothetical protein